MRELKYCRAFIFRAHTLILRYTFDGGCVQKLLPPLHRIGVLEELAQLGDGNLILLVDLRAESEVTGRGYETRGQGVGDVES